jgi:hypothetical protein
MRPHLADWASQQPGDALLSLGLSEVQPDGGSMTRHVLLTGLVRSPKNVWHDLIDDPGSGVVQVAKSHPFVQVLVFSFFCRYARMLLSICSARKQSSDRVQGELAPGVHICGLLHLGCAGLPATPALQGLGFGGALSSWNGGREAPVRRSNGGGAPRCKQTGHPRRRRMKAESG